MLLNFPALPCFQSYITELCSSMLKNNLLPWSKKVILKVYVFRERNTQNRPTQTSTGYYYPKEMTTVCQPDARRKEMYKHLQERGLGSGWRKWSMSCFYPAYWSGIPRRLNNGCPETSVWQRSCWLIFYFCFCKGLPLFTFRMQLINTQAVSFPLLLPAVYKHMEDLPASSLVRALWGPWSEEEPQGRSLRRKAL